MNEKLTRLNRLVGTDAGFYVLALHSFVEHYIRDVARGSDAEKFSDVVWEYRQRLLDEAGGEFVDGLSCLTALAREHRFTNIVRHSFGELDSDEAIAATHLFVVFCGLVGIASFPEVRALEHTLHVWNERATVTEQNRIIRTLQQELMGLQARNSDLLGELSEYEVAGRRVTELENGIERYTLELEDARKRLKEKDSRVDELRRERARLTDERKSLMRRMDGYRELELYIRSLGRLSVYTRTRMDYERTLMRLTPEQEEVAASIAGDTDFLIRGGAGTGKSLVLIDALRRALSAQELQFDEAQAAPAVLLTFTRTLVKFEDYIASILKFDPVRSLVETVDFFILTRLQRIDAKYHYDFEFVANAVAALNTTEFFSDDELLAEIETHLFGNIVTREQYLDEIAPRTGMRRRLGRVQREAVWAIRAEIERRMRELGVFSRNFARMVILEYLDRATETDTERLRDVRTIFLDETQDLTAGDLMTLKRLATGHLIMASDTLQSIYGVSSPFMRAGIQIAGRTRVLHTNFRNTRQILETATRFSDTAEDGGFAFRDGPPVELYRDDDGAELLSLLVRKLELFRDHLGYELDNICVLTPHNAEIGRIARALADRDIETKAITDPEFTFSAHGAVRLSTLHSSKGLDFPVVFLYLPYLNRRVKFDDETTDRLLRNLIYVGITRGMESVSIFVSPGDDQLLHELCLAVTESEAQAESGV